MKRIGVAYAHYFNKKYERRVIAEPSPDPPPDPHWIIDLNVAIKTYGPEYKKAMLL